jgi:undecaprenyl-diphosphatase
MDLTHAIILGIVEGITEYLPVSSTGHMIIASHLMHMPQTEFLKTFEIAIQLGAIGAVFSLYWRTFLLDWEVGCRVLAAFVPTAIIGFILYKGIKEYLLGNVAVVGWALCIGGALLILFELFYKDDGKRTKRMEQISYPQALAIGVCQALAVIPGVSRSAATIVGGLMLGVSRQTIVEFSFLLAVPTMLAATVLDVLKSHSQIRGEEWSILAVGFAVAFITAFGAVKFLLSFVKNNTFMAFGIYRIVIGTLVLLLLGRAYMAP